MHTKSAAQLKHNPAGWAQVWNEAAALPPIKSVVARKSLLTQAWWQTSVTVDGEQIHLSSTQNRVQPPIGRVFTDPVITAVAGECAILLSRDDCFNVASTIASQEGAKVAVIVPSFLHPGGGVDDGADLFVADIYRRTDLSLAMERSLIHISEPMRLLSNLYAVICLK